MAGHETTANVLAWALFILTQDSASARRLAEELRAVLSGRPATLEDLPRLPFARAVIEETMRLYPPVPLLSRQAVADGTIAGRPVRKGSIVLVSPWILHRRPRLWDQPDAFIPDRFLPGAPRPPRHAYIPFSTGPRVCTGQHLGLAEAVICLATLFQAVELRLAPGVEVMPVARLTLRPGAALPMLLRPRG
jgi:cytochrome P450